jgi:hypothetical protein
VVTANSTSGSDSVSVTFGALAALCLADCAADPGCATLACNLPAGGSGTCSSTTPSTCLAASACTPNPPGATTETSCSDGIDNSCNGDIDCADTACADQPCQPGSPTFLCKSGVCTDTTTGLAIEVTPARTRLPAVAGAATAIPVKVTSAGQPVQGMDVSISTTFGSLSAATGTTLSDGTVTFTLTTPGTVGVATVTASLAAVPQITATATVTVPRLGSFQLSSNPGSVQHAVMGARESGWNELGWVQVQVLDDVGEPYPDGLPVRFEHRPLGGSTLGAPLTGDVGACVAPACVGYQGLTASGDGIPDSAGHARAYLYSGTVAGTLAVSASTTADGVTRSIVLPTVAVVGAKASGTNFSIVCSPRNVPALAETDCAISLVDAPFRCEALLKDRFSNLLGTATQVIFASEAAAVGPVVTTPALDPTKAPPADLGVALQTFSTLGAGLPFDVAPASGPPLEPSVAHGLDGCGVRTHNPRDGVVTVVAIADGEEAFFDANGNGVYDATPTAEPFVDQGEPFVDQDDSGAWGAGEWFLDLDGDGSYDLPNGAWDANAKIWTQTVVVYTGTPATMISGADLLGTRWATDASFTDACTATAVPPLFTVNAAQAGPPPVAATSAPHWVVGSDMNLNRLASATTYAVTVESGTVTVDYQGLPGYADSLGMFYRYWPCAGGACASQCRSTTSPCLMTPSIDSYSCGIAAPAIVWGGSSPDAGTDRVDWTVSTPYSVYGTGKTEIQTRSLFGTSN